MTDLYNSEPEIIKKRQWELLKEQLHYAAVHSPFYSELLSGKNIDPEKVNSIEDFRKIPITSKEDLQTRNQEFFAIPKEEVIDYVTTSGTLGKPVSFALNEADLERLAENEYQSFKTVGVQPSDTVQITTTLDRRFMAGMAYFLGLRKLGAGIVRTGSGLPQLQWESIKRFKPQYIIAVPSFLLKMIAYAKANGIDYKNSSVKAAICIGEPLRNFDFGLNALGKRINELWDIELFSTYASTEMATAFTECSFHKGNHSLPDLIFTEILDESGNQVNPGETGELVVTPLQTKTMPLLRFATGDMLTYYPGNCACGRNSLRLSSVLGRKKQMIKLKGTSLYPQQIIEALNSFPEVENFVIESRLNDFGTDEITVKIPKEHSSECVERLKTHFKSELQVTPFIVQVSKEVINELKFPKESRKPQVFRDYRKDAV
ncbi:phenylacetate--CoA ligase family protein [Salegentibacter chungangensis]|uniref:Phenylacetate--CoA ligase family protein n=1 Tax=Salegentibacter chungangensis TaxID=1335724 RepID=A0ABW3NTJ8_9FLAO